LLAEKSFLLEEYFLTKIGKQDDIVSKLKNYGI